MNRPLFIFGTGGHARDIADIAEALSYRPVFVAHNHDVIAAWTGDYDIIIENQAIEKTDEAFALGIGDNKTRAALARKFRGQLKFPTLIHPDVTFGRGSREAAHCAIGTIIFAGVRMTNNVSIGDFCTINLSATVSHDVVLGNYANISPGANIAGNVEIGEGAWIGVGAAINQGLDQHKLAIGAWSVIGSGAVVISQCDAGATYVGVPARKLK